MGYSVAITKSGQMTLPKELREFLGVDGARRVVLEKQRDGVMVKRKLSEREMRAFFDSNISEETRKIIAEDRKKGITSVNQIKQEIAKSPQMQAYWREKYGS